MAKFADICRNRPFELTEKEDEIVTVFRDNLQPNNQKDAKGRATPQCCKYLHVGVFFDGTNNNKYFDTPSLSHSNVARLYDVFPGEGVTKAATSSSRAVKVFNPKLGLEEDKMKHDNKTAADAVPLYSTHDQIKSNRQYFRKIYVPGVGTPFQAVGDDNSLVKNLGGEAMGLYGEERIHWAICQVVSLMIGRPITYSQLISLSLGGRLPAGKNIIRHTLPKITKLKLYVFGFSRGATAARSFCQQMQVYFKENRLYGDKGKEFIEIEYVFLGLFDSVASVGDAHGSGFKVSWETFGHNSWADIRNMNPKVKKCVHMIAAHEARGSFPITPATAICNAEEIVYPGVHSDLGGGYSPYEQGKSIMDNGDSGKLSQIPLADMYRKALLAGVPFLLPTEWETHPTASKVMKVHPVLIKDFNAYCDATKIKDHSIAGLLRHHYNFYIRWRRLRQHSMMSVMERRLARIPDSNMRQRDRLDFRDSNQFGLTYELDYLHRSEKEGRALLGGAAQRQTTKVLGSNTTLPGEKVFPFDFPKARQQKYKEWVGGIKAVWNQTPILAENSPVTKMFDDYVHDSIAWFRVETPEAWGYLRRRFIVFKAAQAKCAASTKNQTAQTTANKPNIANKQVISKPRNYPPIKLSKSQIINREIKNEEVGLVRAKAQLNAAVKKGANPDKIQKLEQTVRDRQANINALKREWNNR